MNLQKISMEINLLLESMSEKKKLLFKHYSLLFKEIINLKFMEIIH